jgi:hypothetical protein
MTEPTSQARPSPSVGVGELRAALSSIPVGGLEVAAADAVAGGAANPHSASASPVADARRAVKRMDTFRHSLDRITRDAIADSLAEISTELERRYGPITEEQLREALSRPQELAQLPALIMANIEDVPGWADSTALIAAHSHAYVLHHDLPEALAAGQSLNGLAQDGSSPKNPSTPPSEAG